MDPKINFPVIADHRVILVNLFPGSSEFESVSQEFSKTTGINPKVIQVVQNKKVWDNYSKHRANGQYVEIFTFHGTKKNKPQLIYTDGLRVEKTTNGLFFARDAIYSHNGFIHHDGTYNQMFMCRILIPSIHTISSGVCSIKNNDHHYPQYLISY